MKTKYIMLIINHNVTIENTKAILIFDKDAKVTQLGKDNFFQQAVSE